jgi:hypothetical protein
MGFTARMLRVTVQPHLPDLDPVSGSMRAAWLTVLQKPPVSVPVPEWAKEALARVAEAAARAGIYPSDLEAESFPGSRFAELAEARDWSEATCCKYAKAGWAHGLALPRLPTPEPLGGPASLPELYLVDDGSPPTVLRAAVWCRLATVWPAPVAAWAELRVTDLELDHDDVVLDPGRIGGGPTIRAPGAAEVTRHWLTWRARLPGDALLCTLRAGPGTKPGSPVSERTLEDAFRKQAVRAIALAGELGHRHQDERRLERRSTYETLTYDTYRRLLLEAGAPPIAPSTRGAVRATR